MSDDDELAAAELAFGLSDGAERQAAERRLAADPAFAAAHARWQDYAAALFTDAGEAPSAAVWRSIEARLPANDTGAVRWWRAGALAAGAAAVVLGIVALQKPARVVEQVAAPQRAPLVAVLTGKQGFATVSFDPASRRLTSATGGLALPGHSPELWVIPADGKPRAIGVMNPAAPGELALPGSAASAMAAGVTIAVSVEPAGGSPSGQPTGPVILTGKLTTV